MASLPTASALAATLATLSSPAEATLAEPPTESVLARLETQVPSGPSFILRGTIPVPPGTYDPDNLTAGDLSAAYPLVVRDFDGSLVLPQIEVVTRYPASSEGAAVVELLAPVTRPTNLPTGASFTYEVLSSQGVNLAELAPFGAFSDPLEAISVPAELIELAHHPIAPYVRARDVHGNWYAASVVNNVGAQLGEPGATDWVRRGHVAAQFRNYATMLPFEPEGISGTPLEHLFGVHSYLGGYTGEGYLSFDVRVSNAFSNGDGQTSADNPIGDVYFRDLEIVLPTGYGLIPMVKDQALGTSYGIGFGLTAWPLAKNPSDGTCHVFGQGFQFHRRFAIATESNLVEALEFTQRYGQGFCQPGFAQGGSPLWSWWNPATSNYFPQRHALPNFESVGREAVLAEIENDFQHITSRLATGESGAPPLTSTALGWAHPYGQDYGGVSGGLGIHIYEGVPTAWAAARNGYRHLETLHRMQMDRTRNVIFDADGTFARLDEWLQEGTSGPYFPGNFYMVALPGHDPFDWADAPTHQEQAAESLGLVPDYANDLLAYESYDMQHLIRATRAAKALAWLGNDPVAKDDLRGQAALVEMSYNLAYSSPFGHAVPTGMRADRDFVEEHPGIGMEFSRGEGWAIDTMAAAFALGEPAYREPLRQWFRDLVDTVQLGQAQCSGFLTAELSSKTLDGNYRTRQAFSHAIVENGLYGVLKSTLAGTGTAHEAILEDVLKRALYALVDAKYWDPVQLAPYQQVAVAPLDYSAPLFCDVLPPDGVSENYFDFYQCWSSFAYGFEMTLDPIFLGYASLLVGDSDLGSALEADGTSNVQNRAALLALVQLLDL